MSPNLASPKRRQRPPADNVQSTNSPIAGVNDAPSLSRPNQAKSLGSRDAASGASPSVTEIGEAMAQLRQLQRKIKTEYRNVGTEFAAEARKIHYGERAPEKIYGQSSDAEREALADEGIDVMAMPWLPSEH